MDKMRKLLHWKKSTIWLVGIAVIICMAIGIFFVADSGGKEPNGGNPIESETHTGLEDESQTESEKEDSTIADGLTFIDYTVDITHDGKDDVIRIIGDSTVESETKLSIHIYSEGTKIFSKEAEHDNASFYVASINGNNYLLYYALSNTLSQIYCSYDLFYVSNYGQEMGKETDGAYAYYAAIDEMDKAEWRDFAENVNEYFADAYLLMGVQNQTLILGDKNNPITYTEKFHWLIDGDVSADKEVEDVLDLFIAQVKENHPSPEKVLYETTADVTHDGIDDLIQTVHYSFTYEFDLQSPTDWAYVKVFRGLGDNVYEKEACYNSAGVGGISDGDGAIGLTQKDDKDYFLYSYLEEYMGEATYQYEVFSIGQDNEPVIVDTYIVGFVTTPYRFFWLEKAHRDDTIPMFRARMEAWIEDATNLLAYDFKEGMSITTSEEIFSANSFYDNIWARDDADEINAFIEEVGGIEDWRVYLYHNEGISTIEWISQEIESDFSEWFTNYNGEEIHRINTSEENQEWDDSRMSANIDVIYYDAKNGEDIQSVLSQMIEAMIIPRMTPSDLRPFTITDYAIEEQSVIQITEQMWLVESLNGYYSYEGTDFITMEEALDFLTMDGEDGSREDGLVPFIGAGSASAQWFILLEEDGIYRLERWEMMAQFGPRQ